MDGTSNSSDCAADCGITWRSGPPLPALRPRTVPELCRAAAARAGAAVVMIEGGRRATWPDLLRWSATLASAWSARVPPGSRVVIEGANSLDHLVAELACWQLAAIAVPLPAGLLANQRQQVLAEVEPVLLVERVPEAFAAEAVTWAPRLVQAADPCLILFTSGSGGTPRGVVLSHDNLCSQQAAFALHWPDIGPGDRLAAYLPWHHSFGALAERLWSLCRGATLTVVPGGGRDHAALLATLHAVQPTVFMSVPKVHRLVTDAPSIGADTAPAAPEWWNSLRWAFTAGAALGEREAAFYHARGIAVCEGWGLTECSPSATLTALSTLRTSGLVGQPIAGVEVGVRTDGRIFVRGPGVMLGYWRRPTATAAVIRAGVLDTGDVGQWTPHGLCLLGRADHTIKLANGEKVHLGELALTLESYPDVRQAVVFSPDGEVLHAVLYGVGVAAAAAIVAYNHREAVPWRRVVQAFALREEPTVENGLLTPSHKIARTAWLAAVERGAVVALVQQAHA